MKRALPCIAALASLACAPAPGPPVVDTSGMELAVAHRIGVARTAVERAPGDPETWGRLAQVLHAHAELEPALAAYRRACVLDPDEARWVYGQACSAHEARRPIEELETLFAAAGTLLPRHAPLHTRLGDARMRAGRLEQAAAAYRDALECDGDLAAAQRGLGHALLALGRADAARPHLERAAALRPEDAAAWAALARAWRALDRSDDARRAAERARAGRPIEFIPDGYRDAVTLLAASSSARLGQAEAALADGDAERSVQHLAAVAEVRSEDPWVWRSLALALRRADRLDEARGAAERAIVLAPGFALAHLELGKVRETQGRLEEAESSYRAVVALEPDGEAGWARLAATLAKSQRTEEALATYRRADGRTHLGPETLADWGVASLAAGNPPAAIAAFERALELDPAHPRAREGLARALEQ